MRNPMPIRSLLAAPSLLLAFALATAAASPTYVPSAITPPAPLREFRGVWVATVDNIDWPSRPGLTVAEQKQELTAILDRAAQLNLNAVIFQVRPACDAFYASGIEPWSPFLTGTMGRAPSPFYDPLAFAISEAHARGLELHAWFNPFRATHPASKSPISPDHVSRTHPGFVRRYGQYLWLDPGDPDAREYSLRVIMDVVTRYDIDGVHFDDYFYPYKDKDAAGRDIPFPDEESWRRYGVSSRLSRDDWRRENVNGFVSRVCQAIHTAKPWVKFGISPFGIWHTGNPPQVKGSSSYDMLYCDSRKWLANGWLDYCAPQLYWPVQSPEQSYPLLLQWWLQQNPRGLRVWPGLNAVKVGEGWRASEIVNQIRIERSLSANPGVILYSARVLMQNRDGLDNALYREFYSEPALVPSFPWLESHGPSRPGVMPPGSGKLLWKPDGADPVARWVVQTRVAGRWNTSLLPGRACGMPLTTALPDAVAITAIDRCGVAGPPAVLERTPGQTNGQWQIQTY
jgi:uncharacterized lipoprotein YddW (UPF0748 family)